MHDSLYHEVMFEHGRELVCRRILEWLEPRIDVSMPYGGAGLPTLSLGAATLSVTQCSSRQ